jgi:membrane protease YdiL (CAAX protease family)
MVPWKIRDVGFGLLLVVAVVVILAIVGGGLISAGVKTGVVVVMVTTVLGCVMLAVTLWLGPIRHKVSPVTLGLRLRMRGIHLLLAAGVLGASVAFNLVYVAIVTAFQWERMIPPDVSTAIQLEGPAVLAEGVVIALWGPFGEELFFRGFVFAGLVGPMGAVGAAVVGATLFAATHVEIAVIIPTFFIGLLLT